LPFVTRLLRTHWWLSFRHEVLLRTCERRGGETFTRFFRVPAQHDVLAGPVIEFLQTSRTVPALRIAVLGCANGAEAYSVASTLKRNCPRLPFDVYASDIDPDLVKVAGAATYSREEVYANASMNESFVAGTFDASGDEFLVKPELTAHVSFQVIDARDPGRCASLGQFDIVFAQNFLFNMRRRTAAEVFGNVYRLLKARSALFIDGMDLDLRAALTAKYRLAPLEYGIEAVHEDARALRGVGWPWQYWGLEPLSKSRREWKRRYATVFLRSE
jgi:hypothetical protein